MTIAGTVFIIGAFWQAAARRHVALLLTGRVFWGIGVGFADQSVTIYNAELAPQQWRGRLHLLIQLASVIGKCIITYGIRCHGFCRLWHTVLALDVKFPNVQRLFSSLCNLILSLLITETRSLQQCGPARAL